MNAPRFNYHETIGLVHGWTAATGFLVLCRCHLIYGLS